MKCAKCGEQVIGGFQPTGFHFPPCTDCFKNEVRTLCRPCYTRFWKEFGYVRDHFVDDFFPREEMGED
jgi:hypothetical protein